MYDKKRIASGFASALVLWTVIAMVVMSSGVALGDYPVAGAGGFTLASSNITAQGLTVYPGKGQSRYGDEPAVVLELQGAVIKDLTISSDISVDNVPGVQGNVTIELTSVQGADLRAQGVILKARAIKSDTATFGELTVQERNRGSARDKFELTGKSATLVGNAEIQAYYLAVRSFDFPAFEANVKWDVDQDGIFEFGGSN